MPVYDEKSDVGPSHPYRPSKQHPSRNPELKKGRPHVTHMEQNVPRIDLSKLSTSRDKAKVASPLPMPPTEVSR
jgi:hypothetical protein